MNKKTLILRLAAVMVLLLIAAAMFIIGRGHTVYFDNKTPENVSGNVEVPYSIEVVVNGKKAAKLKKKNQKVTEIKELRLSPNIDENDLNTKANQARKFLQHGDKVKVTLKFRGREMAHMNLGREILDSFAEKLEDVAVVEKAAKLEGRNMIMFLSEKK